MKDLTTPLEIAQFLIDCAERNGIKTYKAASKSDAKTKIVTSNLSETETNKN